MPLEKSIEQLSEDDLRALGAQDALALELKSDLPRRTNSGKLEALNDLASFANAVGGHLIYGIKGGGGSSLEIEGLDTDAATSAMEWIEQAAWNGIEPRIPGLRIKAVPLSNSKVVLAVRIPKTPNGPHMVVFQEENKFFSRNASGKYALEVEELRAAFSQGETLREKMRVFRTERLNAILNRSLTINLSELAKVVLHLLPVNSFRQGFRIDLERVSNGDVQALRPIAARGLVCQFNYDGLIAFSSTEKHAYSHIQIFRNGCMEASNSSLLEPRDGRRFIPSALFEREIATCGNRMLAVLRNQEIAPPYVAMLSLLGVRGYNMFVGSIRWQPSAHPVEREHLHLEEVIIDDANRDFAVSLRPAFDQVWNSCGWPRSLNYDEQGNWREHVG